MLALHIIFYIFAVVAIGSAIAVVTVRNPVRSVLSLVVTFFAMAAVWMMLSAEFLSLILLLVYVGAVMTLFLFVVMMLNIDKEKKHTGFVRYLPLGLILVLLIIGLIIVAILPSYTPPFSPLNTSSVNYSNLEEIGAILYTDYAYAFEIAGVLLLTAIIAAIALTHRGPTHRKVQKIREQVSATPKNSMRVVKIAPHPGPLPQGEREND